jgi:hypothetical protein
MSRNEVYQMLREAKEHEVRDFGTPTARAMPFDGDDSGDHSERMEAIFAAENERYRQFYMPTMPEQVAGPGSSLSGRSIGEEVTEMELNNTLKPYTTPIGLPRRVRARRPLTKAQLAKEHNERMERQRTAMLKHRRHNDAVLASLIRRTI